MLPPAKAIPPQIYKQWYHLRTNYLNTWKYGEYFSFYWPHSLSFPITFLNLETTKIILGVGILGNVSISSEPFIYVSISLNETLSESTPFLFNIVYTYSGRRIKLNLPCILNFSVGLAEVLFYKFWNSFPAAKILEHRKGTYPGSASVLPMTVLKVIQNRGK